MLPIIEAYYDAVPRANAVVEEIGPVTVFIKPGAEFPYYARPTLGRTEFTRSDVERVRALQREFHVPESFEWVAETTPGLAAAAVAAGLVVIEHPLMVLGGDTPPRPGAPEGVEVRLVTESDDLALLNAIGHVAFGTPGSAVGPAGLDAALAAVKRDPAAIEAQRERLRSGLTVMAVALVDGRPVGIGSHQPVGPVSEIVGVGVLPAFRRRGIAAAITRQLVDDSLQRGVTTLFLSANDETIARIYARIGFRRIATACIAEP